MRELKEVGISASVDADGAVAIVQPYGEVFIGPVRRVEGDLLLSIFTLGDASFEPAQRGRLLEAAHDATRQEFGVKVHLQSNRLNDRLRPLVEMDMIVPCGRVGAYVPLALRQIGDVKAKLDP